jgi:uncharacterized protein YbcI
VHISREERAAIGEAIVRLEREFYGRGPRSVRVSVSDGEPDTITVLSIDSLTAMDRTLSDRNMQAAIVAHHQAIHEATAADFLDEVEKILDRRPTSYLSQVDPVDGYAVRVFIFDVRDHD